MNAVDARHDAAARRAFIRAHHPDRGGSTSEFVRGLAEFDRPSVAASPVLVVRSRRIDRVATRSLRTLRRRIAGRPRRDLR